MSNSLYSMTTEMMAQLERLLDAEGDDAQQDALQQIMTDLADDIDRKVERIAFFRLELERREKVKKEIAKQYSESARAAGNHADRLKEYLILCLQKAGMDKVKTDAVTVSIYNGPERLVLDDQMDPALVPDRFFCPPPPPQIDNEAVKEALKSGEELAWARLERRPALRVKL